MGKNVLKIICVVLIAVARLTSFTLAAPAATLTIQNNDAPGEGFNDSTVVAAVPGNSATTLGGQRLNAAQAAADAWGKVLTSPVTIVVGMNFDPLSCNAGSALLGQAGPTSGWRDFVGAPRAGTWYAQALADSLAGSDQDPGNADIAATFNSSIDFNNNCLSGTDWWYGIGSPAVSGTIDFFRVLLHEIGHGLGFLTFVDSTTGAKALGFDDAYMVHLEDHSLGMNWPNMSNGQRVASAIDTSDLHWTGPNAVANSSVLSGGVHFSGHIQMYAPNPLRQGSSVSHWDTAVAPNELMEPFATPDAKDLETYQLFRDMGWIISGSVTATGTKPPSSSDSIIAPINYLLLKTDCVVGTWNLSYDWGCTGFTLFTTTQYHADHTWSAPGFTGTWTHTGNQITMAFTGLDTIYSGTVNATCDYMSGTMDSSGTTGCWTSTLVSRGAAASSDILVKQEELLDEFDLSGQKKTKDN